MDLNKAKMKFMEGLQEATRKAKAQPKPPKATFFQRHKQGIAAATSVAGSLAIGALGYHAGKMVAHENAHKSGFSLGAKRGIKAGYDAGLKHGAHAGWALGRAHEYHTATQPPKPAPAPDVHVVKKPTKLLTKKS